MDSTACNYDDSATISSTCSFAAENFDCDENCIAVVDCADVCGGSAVEDVCDVCNGDGSSCLGCDGEVNSGLTLDECGECGGDGLSCAGRTIQY